MSGELLLVLALLGVAIVLFSLGRPRADVVALLMVALLPFTGVIDVSEAIAGFADPSVVLIALLFVIGEGLVRTGLAQRISSFILRVARGDETVLELGCGPGYFSIALRDATPHGRLVLFDLQPEMLSMAVERTGSRSGLAAVNGNAVALPFAAGAFDLVFIAAVLGEVPDRLACLQEVRRTLRPGGRLVVNEVRGDPDYIKATDLDRLCREAGLRLLRRRRGRLRWTCVAEFAPD